MGWRWGSRRERSSAKEEVAGSRTLSGVRDSLLIVQRRPRWLWELTRVWKAVCSSWEAIGRFRYCSSSSAEDIPDIPDCILLVCFYSLQILLRLLYDPLNFGLMQAGGSFV